MCESEFENEVVFDMNKSIMKHAASIVGMTVLAITVTTIRYAVYMPGFMNI